jgi:hypothetical protein
MAESDSVRSARTSPLGCGEVRGGDGLKPAAGRSPDESCVDGEFCQPDGLAFDPPRRDGDQDAGRIDRHMFGTRLSVSVDRTGIQLHEDVRILRIVADGFVDYVGQNGKVGGLRVECQC